MLTLNHATGAKIFPSLALRENPKYKEINPHHPCKGKDYRRALIRKGTLLRREVTHVVSGGNCRGEMVKHTQT